MTLKNFINCGRPHTRDAPTYRLAIYLKGSNDIISTGHGVGIGIGKVLGFIHHRRLFSVSRTKAPHQHCLLRMNAILGFIKYPTLGTIHDRI